MNDHLKVAMDAAKQAAEDERDSLFRPARGQQSPVVDSVLKPEADNSRVKDMATKQRKVDALRPLGA